MIYKCSEIKKLIKVLMIILLTSCSSSHEQEQVINEVSEQNRSETVKKEHLVDHLYENQLVDESRDNQSSKDEKISLEEISIKGSAQLKRELNQVLSYHCMKHRKRFTSENQCLIKVNQVVKRCESEHTSINPEFVKCIKESLKKI